MVGKKLIAFFCTCLLIFSCLGVNTICVKADTKDNEIFSLDKDGFWAPLDSITHEFTVENIWGQSCYFDYLKFNDSYIKNTATGENYTLEEAIEKDLIDAYDVVISLDDKKYGQEIIFNGKLKDLVNTRVLLKKDIYMELDTVVNFTINISFDAMADNRYQDMQYVFIFYPHAYKVIPILPDDPIEPGDSDNNIVPDNSGDSSNNGGSQVESNGSKVPVKTGDYNYYSIIILLIIMIISLETMILSSGRKIKEEYLVKLKKRGDT